MDIDSTSPAPTPPAPTPPAPTPPAPTPQPTVISSPRRRMSPAAIAGLVVAALLVGYGAYAYFTNSWPLAPAEPLASESPSPSVTVDPMGWKTYTNTEFGFQLTFPNEWEGYFVTRRAVQRSDFPSGANFDADFEKMKGTVHFYFTVKDLGQDFEIFAISAYPKAYYSSITEGPVVESIGERNGYVFAWSSGQEAPMEPKNQPLLGQVRQIISTFKFTDPTAGWKTYTNTQYGFELKYPPSWQVSAASPNTSNLVQLIDNATPVVPETDVPVNGVFVSLTSGPTKGSPTTVSGKNALVSNWEGGAFGPGTWKELFILTSPGIHITMSALSDAAQTLEDQILSTFRFTP